MKKPMKKPILSEEFRRMQKLAGIITEEEYMNQGQGIEQFEDYIDGMWEASISDEMEEGEYYEGVWEKSEYSDEENYPLADQFNGLSKYLSSVGGKATSEGNPDIDLELMPNGDIKFGATVTLDESLNENVAQVVDSLGIDKTQLGTIANKIRSKMELVNEVKNLKKAKQALIDFNSGKLGEDEMVKTVIKSLGFKFDEYSEEEAGMVLGSLIKKGKIPTDNYVLNNVIDVLDESLDENISGNSSSLPIKETLNMLSDLFGKITDIDIYRLSQPEQQALADLITMCETFTNEYLEDVRNLG